MSLSSDRLEATIAAIATPPGAGGIGIIRVSGPLAPAILSRIFRPRQTAALRNESLDLQSHRLYYGWVVDPDHGTPIDEVLAVCMRAPHTYTREEVVEIQCHGGYAALREILSLVFRAGARPADPGEFTQRAFLNGRIDLTRAEAVLDLIQARTGAGLRLASAQLRGGLHDRVAAIRDRLVAMLAVIEVAIDFPEDEGEILRNDEMLADLEKEVAAPVRELIAMADRGAIFREGISAVILGRPNVGKSSLLNTLLREERALVTEIPGTTRDTIEEYVDIKGLPVRLVDTAGIREAGGAVEELGIQRARAKQAEADLILFMVDGSQPLSPEDHRLYDSIRHRNASGKVLVVINKADLAVPNVSQEVGKALPGEEVVVVSAKAGTGIDQLEEAIFAIMTGDGGPVEDDTAGAPNLRHRAALVKALDAVALAAGTLARDASPDLVAPDLVAPDLVAPDLVAMDLRGALDHLGDIVGVTTAEDVLEMIFERFCIGK